MIDTDGGEAVAGSDVAEGIPAPHWYVLWVRSRAEKTVRDDLIRSGIEAYAATRREVHLWRSKDMRHQEKKERRIVEIVLIHSIVFVRFNPADRKSLALINDITNAKSLMQDPARKRIVMQDSEQKRVDIPYIETLARVSDREMRLLQEMLAQSDAKVGFTASDFTLGEQVRILTFPEGNNIAQVVRLSGDNDTYVGVRLTFLGCAYMKVSVEMLQKL